MCVSVHGVRLYGVPILAFILLLYLFFFRFRNKIFQITKDIFSEQLYLALTRKSCMFLICEINLDYLYAYIKVHSVVLTFCAMLCGSVNLPPVA